MVRQKPTLDSLSPAGSDPATVTLTIGTAGHIDHGKTQLVKLLTGCDTDRLPEEKARGMTIDLGFATCRLPDNRRVGIVDVPGHERFIHNMVAGASGIDAVLLVVAADDGVMPQTIEHFHIVRLLGVAAGMVAITKIDIVEQARTDDAEAQVRELIKDSFLENAPIVPISSKTGAGFDRFYETFVALVNKTAERNSSGAFRLHVERSFALKGLGTILSGIPRSGTVTVGDTLELLPDRSQKKVRGIHVYGEDSPRGRAGECVALRLNDLGADEARRGSVLASPGYFEPTTLVDARFFALPSLEKPLKPRTAVRFHTGTSDVPGYLLLPELTRLPPGGESYVQFQLKRPVVVAPGDFFVARMLSPVTTIGGGRVVAADHVKMRRSKGTWTLEQKAHEEAFNEPKSAMLFVLKDAGNHIQLLELARLSFAAEDKAAACIQELVEEGAAIELPGQRFMDADLFEEACNRLLAALANLHDEYPLSVGFPRKQLFALLEEDTLLLRKIVGTLLQKGELSENNIGLCLPDRKPTLSEGQSAMGRKLAALFAEGGFATPRREELPALIGTPEKVLSPIVSFLVQTGELIEMPEKILLHRTAVELSKSKLVDAITRQGAVEAGQFKDILGTTRKYAIPILEYWDAQGLTKRVGNTRVLRDG